MGADSATNDRLREFLAEIARAAEFPALSRSIEQVMVKVEEDASIHRITNVILKDYSLTLRLLRTANSALYNRSGRQIHSISQAVTLLGVQVVREMATGVVLLEHFRRHSPGLKELILLSLLTANHAREVADLVGCSKGEEAYLCGMFRNLGEVLVAGYHPRGYAAVLLRVQEDRLPVAQACLEVLGFEYDEAAKAVAAHWRIPESVTDCMTARVRLRRAPSTDAERLEAAVHFAHRLTNAVYRREANAARASLNLLLHSHGPALNLTHEIVRNIVERALVETSEVFQAMSVPMDHLRLKRLTEAALRPMEETDSQTEPGSDPDSEPETLLTLLRDVTAQVDRGSAGDLKSITRMVLEALYRGGPFDRVLFAVVDEEGRRLVGKIGFGEAVDTLIQNFNFKIIGESSPVATAVLKRTDVFVAGPRDRRHEGTKFSQTVGAPIFGLYPVTSAGAVVGCLYFDRQEQKSFDAPSMAAIGALRDQLCRALAGSRAGSILTTAALTR